MAGAVDILVPVADSRTLRNTVAYALRQASEAGEATESRPTVHFVYPIRWRPIEGMDVVSGDTTALLEKVKAWAGEDLDDAEPAGEESIRIRTDRVGEERYLFSPTDYAETLYEYASAHDVTRVILDPEYQPGGTAPLLRPLKADLERSGLTVEEAPTARAARRGPIATRATLRKFGLIFGASYAFYLILAGSLDTYNLATGALVAGLAAGIFASITVERPFSWRPLFERTARLFLYMPYLVWEIAKANISVAYIILHPKLPIDPQMVKYEAAVWGDYSVTTLANSITLTPGTLTVDVRRDSLYIHSLTQNARDGINDGGLERAVRFIFSGREAMHIPSPAERGNVNPPEAAPVRRGLREAITELGNREEIEVPERPEGWEDE